MNERYLEALGKLKKDVEDLKVQVNTQKELVNTYRNDKLIDKYEIKDDKWYYNGLDTGKFSRGETGKAFTYEDFTPEQLEALRGPKGDSFTFDDLTPEEIVLLTGADGLDGKPGKDGYTPIKGVDYFDGKDGKDGRDGIDGKDGETPELEIGEIKSVSTYDPAKVSLKKKKNKYIINMDIPRGRPGSNGSDGSNGSSATINGVNTLNIEAGKNITLNQQGNTLTINATGGGGGDTTDVQINGTSITEDAVANIITKTAYNASTNKIATESDLPTKVSDLTNDSGFINNSANDLVNYYTKTDVDSKIASVYKYKGSVSTYSSLPSTGLTIGDVYNIEEEDTEHGIKAGDNVAWNGTVWDVLAGTVDISGKQDIMQFTSMPTASATYEGKIVQYIGNASGNYLTGYFYRCIGILQPGLTVLYFWNRVDVQPSPGNATVITAGLMSATDKAKLDGIESEAEKNIVYDVLVDDESVIDENGDAIIDLSGKLDTSKVKTTKSTTSGNVYDVTYINTVVGDIETLLSEV